MSPIKYVQEAVSNCTVHVLLNMHKKAENSFMMEYDPELDTSLELDLDTSSCYLTIISTLRWMIKLGRIEIITDVSLLLSHVVPREAMSWPILARDAITD